MAYAVRGIQKTPHIVRQTQPLHFRGMAARIAHVDNPSIACVVSCVHPRGDAMPPCLHQKRRGRGSGGLRLPPRAGERSFDAAHGLRLRVAIGGRGRWIAGLRALKRRAVVSVRLAARSIAGAFFFSRWMVKLCALLACIAMGAAAGLHAGPAVPAVRAEGDMRESVRAVSGDRAAAHRKEVFDMRRARFMAAPSESSRLASGSSYGWTP
jgi:hypothetical protein